MAAVRVARLVVWGLAWACLVWGGGHFCAQGTAWSGEPPILIGGTVSLEGKYRKPSKIIQTALRLWAGQVNKAGGLLRRPVKLILYDDQSDRQLCKELYTKLIHQDKVDLVVSPYSTTLTLAASEVTEPAHYVLLAFAASGSQVWERGYHYVFGVYAPADRYFIGFLDVMARHRFKTVAVVHEDSPFNVSAAAGAMSWAERFGLEVVLFRSFHDGARELPQVMKAVRAARPDGLVFSAYPPDCFRALAEMRALGYRPPAVGMSITPALPDFLKKAGPMGEGVFGPSQWEPNARIPFPGTRRFIRDYKEFSGGAMPSYHAASAYSAMKILETAINHFGRIDQDKIRDYVLSLDTVTVIGRFKVDMSGRQVGHSPLLIQWQKGVKQIVYPPNMQTAPPLFPASAAIR